MKQPITLKMFSGINGKAQTGRGELSAKQKFEELFNHVKNLPGNYFIADMHSTSRRRMFDEYLKKYKWIKFDPKVHGGDNNSYDYVYVSDISSPEDVYEAFLRNVDKIVIFDNDKILSHSNYTNVLNGGISSGMDSEGNWQKLKVWYRAQPSFVFEGRCIILSEISKKDLKKKRHLHLLLRNTILL